MLYKFLSSTAFSAVFSAALVAGLPSPVAAQSLSSADSLIVDMNKAFKRGDKARLTQMLPQARGHALEAWAAYWELRARLSQSFQV